MTNRGATFEVSVPIVRLTITIVDGAVTRIEFRRRGHRPAETEFERQVEYELEQYFAGTRQTFTFPIRPEGTEFEQGVWHELQRIPYGETRTYGDLARTLGNPNAARAIGTANGRNPIPIVIPCHRVVAAGGKLGGYGGGLDLKRKLLDLEARNSPAVR